MIKMRTILKIKEGAKNFQKIQIKNSHGNLIKLDKHQKEWFEKVSIPETTTE